MDIIWKVQLKSTYKFFVEMKTDHIGYKRNIDQIFRRFGRYFPNEPAYWIPKDYMMI